MKNYLDLLSRNEIFQGIPQEVIFDILNTNLSHIKNFPAGKIIHEIGQPMNHMGIVLEGTIDIVHPSASGHDTIVSRILPGGIFGESFSCAESTNLFNEIRSVSASTVLFLNVHAIFQQLWRNRSYLEVSSETPNRLLACYHLKLIENILGTLARVNVWLNTKILILNQKTLRDKILTYFETLAVKNNSNEFMLPFNREQLASFLGSERSSLCRELSKMQEEGILKINKDYVVMK